MNEDIELIHIPCHVCNSKALAMQDDKPVCLEHFSMLSQVMIVIVSFNILVVGHEYLDLL